MEAEHPERKNRIKLRVLTSTGLNLLCTANRSQKVKQLLPHIIKLYEEVKEDQGLKNHQSQVKKPFIKFIRKQEFLIAPSQLVGDIFDDNDEVFCEITDEAILNLGAKPLKKEKQVKQQTQVKSEPKPPKTKKIKKKNSKQQTQLKDNKQPEKPVQIQQVVQQKQPISTQKVNMQPQNNQQLKEKVSSQTKQNVPKVQPPKQGKKKKNKNNNNNKPTQQKATQQKEQKKEAPSKSEQVVAQKVKQSSKANVKKAQVSEPKSTSPLLSNDQLAKFRQLMKKSTPAENNQ